MSPRAGDNWLRAKRAVYLKWMKILAVLAVVSNALAEIHYRQLTSVRLPENVATVVSYVAAASASMFVAAAVLGLMFYVSERQ